MTPQTVSVWRKELGVPQGNEGTRRLHRDWFPELRDEDAMEKWRQANKSPERAAKIAKAKRGKPRPQEVMAKVHRANVGRKASEETRRKMSEAHKRRGTWPPSAGRPWTAEEDALLGTMLDREVAERIGRDAKTVFARRKQLGIRSFKSRNGSPASTPRKLLPEDYQSV